MTGWWREFRSRFGRKPPVICTTIDGTDYSVTEWARKQAAANLKADLAKREAVERMIGADAARERYPEAFE